jgi:hypothetical protein
MKAKAANLRFRAAKLVPLNLRRQIGVKQEDLLLLLWQQCQGPLFFLSR